MVLIIILSITSKYFQLYNVINELISIAVINILYLFLIFSSNKFSWLTNYTKAMENNEETNSSDLLPGVGHILVIPLKNKKYC